MTVHLRPGQRFQARATRPRIDPLGTGQRQGVMSLRRAIVWLALPVLVAGCGEHRVQPPVTSPAAPAASLVISEGFGAKVVRDERVAPGQSVLAALQGVAKVSTRYGGRFVQSIDGKLGLARRRARTGCTS